MARSGDGKRAGKGAWEVPGGGRDCDWPLFVQGGPGDRARPNAWQVMVLNDLSGAGRAVCGGD